MLRALALALALPAVLLARPAWAGTPYVVRPGETLWTIASAHNFTTRAFAAANGLSENSAVVAGTTLQVPTVDEAAQALARVMPAAAPVPAAAAPGPAAPAPAAARAPSPAPAGGGYVVRWGDTLSGIAAAHGISVSSLAAANLLDPAGVLLAGRALELPGASAPAAAPVAGAPAQAASAPPPLGAYTVRSGDSLSAIAARAKVPAAQIAAMNGLDLDAPLLIGTVIKLPTGANVATSAPAPAQRVVPAAAPAATPGRVTQAEIAAIASQAGVPPALASAIAWQESGFNNAFVSSANARGVMQILPGTWSWIQRTLAGRTLDASSPADNVHAGVLYLRHLLQETGGDQAAAAAAYYQGLGALRSRGMFEETKRYVASVMALRGRFGG